MLQAVMTAPGRIEFHDLPVPEPKEGQVLIRIMRIGICGSDIHVYHGKHPYTSYPVVQGHEVSARVIKTGPSVAGLKEGDKVTVQPQVFCGSCYPCRHGKYHICDKLKVMGFQTTGMASEYFAADAEKVLKLPDKMSFDGGALVEPAAVAVHALRRAGEPAGKKILVLGAGPIGNLVAQCAKAMGAGCVMITDISSYRLEIAKSCGVDFCVDVTARDLEGEILEKMGPDKADLILECVGSSTTIDQAVKYARKGSDIIVVGVFGSKPAVDLGLVQDRELRLIGTLMYQKSDYEKAIELISESRLKLTPLITDHFPFRDYLKAYQYIEEKKDRSMKVMIDVG